MTRVIRTHEFGGPEVLKLEEDTLAPPEPGEAQVRHTAIGLNLADAQRRKGTYHGAQPGIMGSEGAGEVTALGDGVDGLAVGDRVAYAGVPGSYCDARNIPAARLVRLPGGIDEQTAAAMMLKGLTVHYLIHWSYAVQPGNTVLIHAAAGGVGLIFCQWARHLGATVIGTVSSDAKAETARAHGCHHALPYDGFQSAVMDLTEGKGCHAVYDSVGPDTIEDSFRCLRPRGTLVSFGAASGPIPPLDVALVRGARFFTRPSLADYGVAPDDLAIGAKRLFEVVESGAVRITVNQTYALADAAQAHRDLEARLTTGSTVLLP